MSILNLIISIYKVKKETITPLLSMFGLIGYNGAMV